MLLFLLALCLASTHASLPSKTPISCEVTQPPDELRTARKIAIQDMEITVPEHSRIMADPAAFWASEGSPTNYLKVLHCKANRPAVQDFSFLTSIPAGLPAALHLAYQYHADILLRPEDVWLTVSYGLAKHISLNAEELRPLFVAHKGKKALTISRPEPIEEMDWEAVTQSFSKALEREVKGEFCQTMACNFSTTTRIEYISSLVSLMSSMKHYFEYRMACGSGIRNVYMTGTLEDWLVLRSKVEALAKYRLGWWVQKLLVIVNQFIATFRGAVNLDFWNYMVDKVDGIGGSSGRSYRSDYTGWLINFYAYTDDGHPVMHKMAPGDFPRIALDAPVLVSDMTKGGAIFDMQFITGFSGIGYENGVFAPQLSYAFAIQGDTKP